MDLILGAPILLGFGIVILYTVYALLASAWDAITWVFKGGSADEPRRPKRRTPPFLP